MDVTITQPYETIVACETCGNPAYRRQVDVGVQGLQVRTISYDTHAQSQSFSDHHNALGRMEEFHDRLFTLIAELKAAIGTEEFHLTYGRIVEIELGNVIPTACNPRSDVVPEATVRAFSREVLIPYHQVPLEGLTKASLIAMLKPACEEAVLRLKAEYDDRHPGDQ